MLVMSAQFERLSIGRFTPSSKPKPEPKPAPSRYTSPYRCGGRCPGDRQCCLTGDVVHQLCVCHNAGCYCHSQERYKP
jgi:hypothetical protein